MPGIGNALVTMDSVAAGRGQFRCRCWSVAVARRAGGWRSAVGMRNIFDSTKSQIHITHVKSVVIGFAFGRFAWQR